MNKYFFASWCYYLPECIYWFFAKPGHIHKVVYHIYVFGNGKRFVSLHSQVVAHCCYCIAFVDAECNYRGISFVFSYQGYIRSVQGSYNGYFDTTFSYYLLCHVCSRCVGYSIVNMQQIQLMVHNDIYHSAAEGYFVWGVIKQRIGRYPHFVIKNICTKHIEPYRLLVSYKMNKMPLVGQCFS